jgi:integrase
VTYEEDAFMTAQGNEQQAIILPESTDASPSPTEIAVLVDQTAREQMLSLDTQLLSDLSDAADTVARRNVFIERQESKAWNTVRKEIAALHTFMVFLEQAEVPLSFHLAEEPRLWSAITFGLIKFFLLWERKQGYAIKTINDHLSIIKVYAKLAHSAGFQTADQLLAITGIPSIRGAEASRIDGIRATTRIGGKKAAPTFLESREEFQGLLNRPDTPQGWRDRVAILLMYDLSLRPSEVVTLQLKDLNMDEGTLRITRHKTNDQQTLRVTQRLQLTLTHYLRLRKDRDPLAPLLVRSLRNEQLVEDIKREEPQVEAARRGGRRPTSPNRALYVQRQQNAPIFEQNNDPAQERRKKTWTPPMTTRALAKRLHEIGLHIEEDLYGETRHPEERINLTSYDGRHEFTRNSIRGGSDPIAVTKAGGWKGNSAMVARYYGEMQIANEDIVLKR